MRGKTVSGIMLTMLLIGMFTLGFNIQMATADWWATEIIYIRADGSIDPEDAPISSVDNVIYAFTDNILTVGLPLHSYGFVVERDNIVVDGVGHFLWGDEFIDGVKLTGRARANFDIFQSLNFI